MRSGANHERVAQATTIALKAVYTAFVLIVIAVYWVHYGPSNFLWFSDIALILLVPALWLESRLLASMLAVGVLFPEVAWMVDYFSRLLTGTHIIGMTRYMFDAERPLYLRGLSLFHILVPLLILRLLFRLGYDPRAPYVQTLFAWLVLIVSYLVSSPRQNINMVYGIDQAQHQIPELLYLALLMIALPLLVFFPTHLLLKRLFPRAHVRPRMPTMMR